MSEPPRLRPGRRRAAWTVALVAVELSFPRPAFASPDRMAAKQAYERGVEARAHGELQRAAEEFAAADAIAPNSSALQAALDSAIEADDVELGAELLERSRREAPPPALASSVTAAHLRFRGRAGQLRVLCPRTSTCTAKVGDRPISPSRLAWAKVGPQSVVVTVDGAAQSLVVDVTPDHPADVVPLGKDGAPLARSEDVPLPVREGVLVTSQDPRRLPPVVVYVGAGVTAALALGTTVFALGAKDTHSSFDKAGCGQANGPDCSGLKDEGQSAQTRANVALAATLMVGAATAVLALVFTDFRGASRRRAFVRGHEALWRTTF